MIKSDLSNIQLVTRTQYLKQLCQGKRVLHLGATDAPETKAAIARGTYLHTQLQAVADSIIGMDFDLPMIQWLAETQGITNIVHGNIEELDDYPPGEFDLIIAGEILEHLDNPGRALKCLYSVMQDDSKLVITVPNAYSLKGFVRAMMKHELIHPDHTLHHSPYTLKALLERAGFKTNSYFSYVNGGSGVLASIANNYLQLNPQLAEGIGVICSRNH